MAGKVMRHHRLLVNQTLKALCLAVCLFATQATAYECTQFRVVGVCIWIVCTSFGCDITVTVKYGHFNPDVIVRVTNEQGVGRVEDQTRQDTGNRNHNNLIYQDSKAYGHPLTGQIYCPSNTSAGSQYYQSSVDKTAWRYGGLDALTTEALVPGKMEVGVWPNNTWGALYPRTGWTTQHSEPKSAAVVAHRVGDFITRNSEPHVYSSILGRPVFVADSKLTWSPSSLILNSNEEGWWQPTTPKIEGCLLFGVDDSTDKTGWGGGRVSKNGKYRHALWRPYTCCEIDKGALIVIDFTPFPMPIIKNN